MNEITIHGNVTAEPVLRYMSNPDSTPYVTFSVAVNRGYYSRTAGKWVEQTAVFHNVIAHRRLAENAALTLQRGTAVTVTGHITDDSFTPADSDRVIRRQRLEAADIAVSLRFATAEVTRQTRDSDRPSTDRAADTQPDADTEPAGATEPAGDIEPAADTVRPAGGRRRGKAPAVAS